jgi:pilus assembly protein CpaC
MAHEYVQGGRTGQRKSENRLAWNARGPSPCAAPWALVVTGLAVALMGSSLVCAQQPAGALSPYGGATVPHQPAKPAAEPERVGAPRPQGEAAQEAPAPRTIDPFSSLHPRLRALPADVKPPVGTTPIPSKEEEQLLHHLTGPFVDPAYTIEMVQGRPRLWYLKEVPFRIQVADENIMTYNIVGQTPREISLLGRQVGTTVLNLWFGDRQDLTKQTVLSFQINVLPDPEEKARLERLYKALEDEINRAFPDAQVCLFLVGDKLVLTGQAKDAVEANKILQIVQANTQQDQQRRQRQQQQQGQAGRGGFGGGGGVSPQNIPVLRVDPGVAIEAEGAQAGVGLNDYVLRSELDVINMLRIPGEQQVMLKVIVAEVSRSAARTLGVDFSITNDAGIMVFQSTTAGLLNNLNGTTTAANAGMASNRGALTNANTSMNGANIMAMLNNGKIPLAIAALRTNNLARSLAEPNLVTLNGRAASFRAGGEFPVPVVTGATNVGLQGVSFVPFGVSVSFTPIITDKDRIRLQVNAEVSTRDVATGANFGTGGTTTTTVPGLTTRNISTTVELREGQTLAIGGLLQNNLGGMTRRVPFFGDIPFGGQIFRRDDTQAEESELVMLVTPELVHPMEPNEIPPLPGSDYFEPGDLEFYLHGKLESNRSYDYRSPVMTDIHRMCAYRHCELLYFVGPHGHCDGR